MDAGDAAAIVGKPRVLAHIESRGPVRSDRAAANHFKVTNVFVQAPIKYLGPCPAFLNDKILGQIHVQGTADLGGHPFTEATVTYTFVRSDGKPDKVRTMVFKKTLSDLTAQSLPPYPPPFAKDWGDPPPADFNQWVAIKMLSPNPMESEKAKFELFCVQPDPVVKKADLTCSVAAYKDAAMTQAIASGDSVAFGPLSAKKVHFAATLKNVGEAAIHESQSFTSQVQYLFNGKAVGAPQFKISGPVQVGGTRTFGVSEMQVPPGATTMVVTAHVNLDKPLLESTTNNNSCQLTFTTKILQRQQKR
ncbi:MAG: hypothetical protein HY616_12855 [Candidatus Rokubacteria bacterium]|nr:hypothetical protein [Candidatus Rokubacteria bacterium]